MFAAPKSDHKVQNKKNVLKIMTFHSKREIFYDKRDTVCYVFFFNSIKLQENIENKQQFFSNDIIFFPCANSVNNNNIFLNYENKNIHFETRFGIVCLDRKCYSTFLDKKGFHCNLVHECINI